MKAPILPTASFTRLNPITTGVSKQRLPMYVKPMVNDSFSELLRAGESQMKHER